MDSTRVEVAATVSLAVRRWAGPESAWPFVLVHGLSSNARLWDAVARELAAAGHAVYAIDLRSHGESDAPAEGYDTGTAAADVAAAMAALGIGRAVVAGQSWGGNVVVRLAAQHPELVSALALVDGGWLDLSAEFDSWDACEAALRPPEIDGRPAAELRGYLQSGHPGWSTEAIEATVANLRIADDDTVSRRLSIPHHMEIVRSMWTDSPWADLSRITVPVLLLPAVPTEPAAAARRRAQVARAAEALAAPRVREYPGADHDLHAEQPEALAKDLLTLVEAV